MHTPFLIFGRKEMFIPMDKINCFITENKIQMLPMLLVKDWKRIPETMFCVLFLPYLNLKHLLYFSSK